MNSLGMKLQDRQNRGLLMDRATFGLAPEALVLVCTIGMYLINYQTNDATLTFSLAVYSLQDKLVLLVVLVRV